MTEPKCAVSPDGTKEWWVDGKYYATEDDHALAAAQYMLENRDA